MYSRGRTLRAPFKVRQVSGYVQSVPYKTPLPCNIWGGYDAIYDREYPPNPLNWSKPYVMVYINTQGEALASEAYAKAYDRLIAQAKGEASAMLAVNVAERKQSFEMIAKRATQILGAYRSLKSLDLKGFLKQLGFSRRKTRQQTQWVRVGKGRTYSISAKKVDKDEYALQKRAKSAGSLWLEYWFGWSPLISDIHASVDILQGVSPAAVRRTFRSSGSANSYNLLSKDAYGFSDVRLDVRVGFVANIDITNPDLLKANRLGLINPATVAWELIPFSFLVDWFIPVSKFLESYTDTLGFRLSRISSSKRITGKFRQVISHPQRVHNNDSNGYLFVRSIPATLPVPGLFDRKGTAIQSATRAATAVSLLTGFLQRSKFSK